jgi:Flp pilus assembly pilin Flp
VEVGPPAYPVGGPPQPGTLEGTDIKTNCTTIALSGRCKKGAKVKMTVRDWLYLLRAAALRQEGQTMAEYGVVLAVITLGVIVALGFLAAAVTGNLNTITTKLGGAIA